MALRKAVLAMTWSRLEPDNALTLRHLQALTVLMNEARGGARIELPGGWRAERDRGVVRFERSTRRNPAGPLRLRVPGNVSWNGCMVKGGWTSADRARSRLADKRSDVEFFAAEGIEGALEVRAAQADEKFIPFGRRNPIPIGEFLSKQKVSRELRFRRAVLADHGGILWVIGVRRSARAAVTATTRRVIRVHAESHD